MSFKATLKIGSKEFDVIAVDYSLHREVDGKGRPAGIVMGGSINITVESTDDTSVLESMVNNQHKPLDGTITFKKSDEDAKLKELSFEKAYVVNFHETFDTINSKAMLTTFTVSAQTIKIGGAEHKNDWPGGK